MVRSFIQEGKGWLMKNLYESMDFLFHDLDLCYSDSEIYKLFDVDSRACNFDLDEMAIDYLASLRSLKDAYDAIPVCLTDEFMVFRFLNDKIVDKCFYYGDHMTLFHIARNLYLYCSDLSFLDKLLTEGKTGFTIARNLCWFLLFISVYDLIQKVNGADESEINRVQRKIDEYCRVMKAAALF